MTESNLSDRIKYSGEKLTNESVENRHCKTVDDKYEGIKPDKLDLEALKEALGLLPQKSEYFIGDIVESFLTPEQFIEANGDDWMPLTGGDIYNTPLGDLLQLGTLPDITGCFIRNVGGKSAETGIKQEQGTARNGYALKFSGMINTSSPAHAHSNFVANESITSHRNFDSSSIITKSVIKSNSMGDEYDYVLERATKAPNIGKTNVQLDKFISWDRSSAAHSFTATGTETRPICVGVNHFVKVK